MDFCISQSDVDFWRDLIKKYKPYADNDPEYNLYDNPHIDTNRVRATNAKKLLLYYGVDISDIMKKWE